MKANVKKLVVISLLFFMASLYAKDYKSEATKLLQKGDFDKCIVLLKEWEKAEPQNIDINIYYFNYYYNKNAKHTPTMGKMKDGRYGMYDRVEYDLNDVKTAISYMDKIIKAQPSRLDVRSSKCSAYIGAEQYDLATKTLIEILDYSKKNNNNWLWTENKSVKEFDIPSGEQLLFVIINECFDGIYHPFESNKKYVKAIIEKELADYPDNTWGLNHAAAYYRETGNYKKSIEILLHAIEIDPTDYVLIGNLGYAYELNKDYLNAKKWYEHMLKMKNPDAVEYGKERLKSIEGKY